MWSMDLSKKTAGWGRFICLFLSILVPAAAAAQGALPDLPDLIRVTVQHGDPFDPADDSVLIQWEPSEDPDIEYYHLYKMNEDRAFVRLFTFSGGTLEYHHLTSGLENLTYSVTAEDSSSNESLFEDNTHQAVEASVSFDPCGPSNRITWTPYLGWDEGQIAGYRIWQSRDGGAFREAGFIIGSEFSYLDRGVAINSTYRYYLEAVNISGLSSLSPVTEVETLYPDAPGYLTIDYVSVIDPHTIELQFSADISGEVKDFRILRRSDRAASFLPVASLPGASQSIQTYIDQVVSTSVSYQYKIESVYQPGGCPEPLVISESNTGNSIVLQGEVRNQMITLEWNGYDSFTTGLSEYNLQQISPDGEIMEEMATGTTTGWSIPVGSLAHGDQPGSISFRVQAISHPGDPGEPGISVSNIIEIQLPSEMQVPNAITPASNDINSVFKPRFDFAPEEYRLIILDRGGRKMFETTDPGEGWNGRFNGENANEGVYVYYIQYTDYTGHFRTHTGNLTLLYP